MSLLQIVYASHPFGYDRAMLRGILLDARRCNRRDGITGALICRPDVYIQMLEGPEEPVRATLARIRDDDRHLDIALHVSETVSERMFGDWDMLHDPARSWLWPKEEIADGVLTRSDAGQIRSVFARLAAGVDARDHP